MFLTSVNGIVCFDVLMFLTVSILFLMCLCYRFSNCIYLNLNVNFLALGPQLPPMIGPGGPGGMVPIRPPFGMPG
jgi:hypothetical protein